MRPIGNDEYEFDSDWQDVAKAKKAIRERNVPGFTGVGDEIGRAALFGSASKFEGRKVTAITMQPVTSVPYEQGKANVDWDKTEKINRVPLQTVNPDELSNIHASQPGLQHAALKHYMSPNQFGGALFDKSQSESNDFPVVFDNEETGERTLLSGHHRTTAAILQGRELRARVIRGRTK
jgi:hypothetical protein